MAGQMIFDPLRRRNVPLTPEEKVRQWFISMLHDELKVPMGRMRSEVAMDFGSDSSSGLRASIKEFRADIVVYGRLRNPLMIVECKRPEVTLDGDVLMQAARYATILRCNRFAVTNGLQTRFFILAGGGFAPEDRPPLYSDMVYDED